MSVRIQKIGEKRSLLTWRRRGVYKVWSGDGTVETMTLAELDNRLEARRFPADYWATVNAANEAFNADEAGVAIEWPIGKRVNLPGS